jgi:hypothetical protein
MSAPEQAQTARSQHDATTLTVTCVEQNSPQMRVNGPHAACIDASHFQSPYYNWRTPRPY